MAVVLVAFGDAIENIAMPALAALLILVGYRTIKPRDLASVWRTGVAQRIVLVTTFALTMAIPLQYAVVAGVALSVVLYVVGQSNHVTLKRRIFTDDGHVIETDPPARLPANDVVVLQPYGSLFFAAAPIFEAALPEVTPSSRNTVVILRLRERSDVGSTFIDVLRRYAAGLAAVGIEARHRVAQRAARRAVPRHRIHRLHRPGEPLPRQRTSRRRARAGATRRAGRGSQHTTTTTTPRNDRAHDVPRVLLPCRRRRRGCWVRRSWLSEDSARSLVSCVTSREHRSQNAYGDLRRT